MTKEKKEPRKGMTIQIWETKEGVKINTMYSPSEEEIKGTMVYGLGNGFITGIEDYMKTSKAVKESVKLVVPKKDIVIGKECDANMGDMKDTGIVL